MLKKFASLVALLVMASPAVAQVVYHSSARVQDPAGGPNANVVYTFDDAGVLTGSYPQAGSAATDTWGYRDGATDGDNNVYFGWGGGINKHAADGTFLEQVVVGGGPNGTWRALAYDPTGDNGSGSIWSGDFGDDILEIDLSGNVLNTLNNGGQYSLYGLTYADDTGNLWGHSSDGEIVEISTADGSVLDSFPSAFNPAGLNGGLSGYSELGGDMAALCQCDPEDLLGIYNTGGTFDAGPYNLSAQTMNNGHLGIAVTVIPEPTAFGLIGMALMGLGLCRRR